MRKNSGRIFGRQWSKSIKLIQVMISPSGSRNDFVMRLRRRARIVEKVDKAGVTISSVVLGK